MSALKRSLPRPAAALIDQHTDVSHEFRGGRVSAASRLGSNGLGSCRRVIGAVHAAKRSRSSIGVPSISESDPGRERIGKGGDQVEALSTLHVVQQLIDETFNSRAHVEDAACRESLLSSKNGYEDVRAGP